MNYTLCVSVSGPPHSTPKSIFTRGTAPVPCKKKSVDAGAPHRPCGMTAFRNNLPTIRVGADRFGSAPVLCWDFQAVGLHSSNLILSPAA